MVPAGHHRTYPRHPAAIASDGRRKSFGHLGHCDLFRTEDGYEVRFHNFKAGELAECMVSNAQRISPIGEAGWQEGDLLEVELLRGEEFIEEA